MGLVGWFCRTVQRTLLYQIFVVFAWFKFLNLEKNATEFKDKVFILTKSVGFSHPQLDKAFKDPILAFKVFLGVQVGCAAVAVLGLPFLASLAGLVCAVALTVNMFVYELTLPGEGKPIVWKDWQGMVTFDSLLSVVIVVGILAQVFCQRCDDGQAKPYEVSDAKKKN
jgi:hypothetical protein